MARETAEQGSARVEEVSSALAQASTARDLAALNLARTRIVAPTDGTLSDLSLRVGNYIPAGKPVLALIDANSLRVEGYFEETKLPRIAVGQPADVHLMGDDRKLPGHVQSIAAGIEDRDRSAGSNLLPNVTPTFSWVRLAQRVPVRIALDNPHDAALIAGRTATVRILPPPPKARSHETAAPHRTAALALRSAVAPPSVLTTRCPKALINTPRRKGRSRPARAPAAMAPWASGWWQLYQDPRLDTLISEALAAIPICASPPPTWRAAPPLPPKSTARRKSRPASPPRLSAPACPAKAPAEEHYPGPNMADAGIRMSYQIDLAGGLKRAAEAAAADVEASRAGLGIARLSVAAEVALAYDEVCGAGHEQSVARRSLALQEESQRAVARLVGGGRKMAVDLPRAAALVEQTRATLPLFAARQRLGLYRIAVLTGHAPGDYPPDLANCSASPQLSSPIPVGDGAALLGRRPDVRQAERQLAGASARIGVATAAFYPTITLGLSAGVSGLPEHLGQAATQRWSLGPLISWSLPGGFEKARLRQADAGADAALAHFDATVLKALQETENALTLLARDHRPRQRPAPGARPGRGSSAAGRQLYRAGRLPYSTTSTPRPGWTPPKRDGLPTQPDCRRPGPPLPALSRLAQKRQQSAPIAQG